MCCILSGYSQIVNICLWPLSMLLKAVLFSGKPRNGLKSQVGHVQLAEHAGLMSKLTGNPEDAHE